MTSYYWMSLKMSNGSTSIFVLNSMLSMKQVQLQDLIDSCLETGSNQGTPQGVLEPCWKGPYVIILTSPTRLKVEGIAMCLHHTHAWSAGLFALKTTWTSGEKKNGRLSTKHPSNPLKLKLQCSWWASLLYVLWNPTPISPLTLAGHHQYSQREDCQLYFPGCAPEYLVPRSPCRLLWSDQ